MSQTNIADRALLVKLTIQQWYNRATDARIVAEVAVSHSIPVNQLQDTYVKALIPKVALRGVSMAANELRGYHNTQTLPWHDGSIRILPSEKFMAYRNGMVSRKEKFEEEVSHFLEKYNDWVELARVNKKTLFDPEQYPNSENIKRLFSVNINFLPFPRTEDFRLAALSESEIIQIQENANEGIRASIEKANKSLLDRLKERMTLLYTALDSKTSFKDNTVLSLKETAILVKELNVTGNQDVSTAVQAVEELMKNVTPQELRDSEIRKNTLKASLCQLLKSF